MCLIIDQNNICYLKNSSRNKKVNSHSKLSVQRQDSFEITVDKNST